MSWDVSIVIDTGGDHKAVVQDVRNVTYNNSDLFRALSVHPKMIERNECVYWILPLARAIRELEENRDKYLPLEPENRWGGIDDSLDFLRKLLAAVKKHPLAEVSWS